jgi:nucleotide-binding universal stress UspA family protein
METRMFSTVVLALDGSEGAKKAIPFAAELAEEEGPTLVLAHVTEYLAAKGGELPHPGEEEIRAEIEGESEQLSKRGIETEVQFADTVLGGPAHAKPAPAYRQATDPGGPRVGCRRQSDEHDRFWPWTVRRGPST